MGASVVRRELPTSVTCLSELHTIKRLKSVEIKVSDINAETS